MIISKEKINNQNQGEYNTELNQLSIMFMSVVFI